MSSNNTTEAATTVTPTIFSTNSSIIEIMANVSANMSDLNGTNITAKDLTVQNMMMEDSLTVILASFVLLLTLCGHGLREAGLARSKNATTILGKTLTCIFFPVTCYWLIGYGFSFGKGNAFIGYSKFALIDVEASLEYSKWYIHAILSCYPSIVSSEAIMERTNMFIYPIYAFFVSGIIYPIVVHWTWSEEGWLVKKYVNDALYQDFGGSGVIHITTGTIGLISCLIIRPRVERFNPITRRLNAINWHSSPLVFHGGIMSIVGMLFMNCSLATLQSLPLGGIVVNCIVCCCAAIFVSSIIFFIVKPQVPLMMFNISAIMSALVSISGGCDVMVPWSAFVTGIIGVILYVAVRGLLMKCRLDDPADVVPIHLVPGIWGVTATALFDKEYGIITDSENTQRIAINVIGALSIAGWSSLISIVVFGIFKAWKNFRIDQGDEIEGLDSKWYCGQAYPTPSNDELIFQRNYFHGVTLSRQLAQTSTASLVNNWQLKQDPELCPSEYTIRRTISSTSVNSCLPRLEVVHNDIEKKETTKL
ncbi:Uncharacterised protein g3827 [Pycnogonum litorale]